jgi:hypothetical protein
MPEESSRYDLARMRFPFTFMGILSVALGLWIAAYFLGHPTHDAVLIVLEVLPAGGLLAFGGWLVVRRISSGRAA